MPLYILRRDFRALNYDEYDAKIIRAKNVKEARHIANIRTGDEGPIWENLEQVTCTRIPVAGKSEELLGSFNAG